MLITKNKLETMLTIYCGFRSILIMLDFLVTTAMFDSSKSCQNIMCNNTPTHWVFTRHQQQFHLKDLHINCYCFFFISWTGVILTCLSWQGTQMATSCLLLSTSIFIFTFQLQDGSLMYRKMEWIKDWSMMLWGIMIKNMRIGKMILHIYFYENQQGYFLQYKASRMCVNQC